MLFSNSEDLFHVPHVIILYLTAAKSPLGACSVASVMSDSLRPYGLWSVRFLRPCDSLGKNTGGRLPCPPSEDLPDQAIDPSLLHCRQILYL